MIQWYWLVIEFVALFAITRVAGLIALIRYRKVLWDNNIEVLGVPVLELPKNHIPDWGAITSTGITPGGVSFSQQQIKPVVGQLVIKKKRFFNR